MEIHITYIVARKEHIARLIIDGGRRYPREAHKSGPKRTLVNIQILGNIDSLDWENNKQDKSTTWVLLAKMGKVSRLMLNFTHFEPRGERI